MTNVEFSEAPDKRTSFFEDDSHRLISSVIYHSSTQGDQPCPSFKFVWKNFAPPRVKFFGWLLSKERIHCRTSLVHKHILQDAQCEICKEGDETVDHIFSGCPFVRHFWSQIGWQPDGIAKVTELWMTRVPPRVHNKVADSLILLCCWEIWRHRNDVVFRGLEPSTDRLAAYCKEAVESWVCRIPRKDHVLVSNWRNSFAMQSPSPPKCCPSFVNSLGFAPPPPG